MRDAIMRNASLFIASFFKSRGRAFDRGTPISACVVGTGFVTRSHELACLAVSPLSSC
jgi:hypothetical protein